MSWKADLIQIAIFLKSSPARPDALQIWTRMLEGKSPDSFQRPTDSPIAPSQASGVVQGEQVSVIANAGRIDLSVQARPSSNFNAPPPQLENISRSLKQLASLAEKLDGSIEAARLGLVIAAANRFETQSQVSATMLATTDGVWFPEPASDSIYQVNVRKQFEVLPDVSMNRVVTLSAGELQLLNISMSFGTSFGTFPLTAIPVVNFKVDCNTAPNHVLSGPFKPYLAELRVDALDILERGVAGLK